MKINEKIRMMREMNQWTQEELAEKIHMSLTSYAKLERGESKLYLEKLEKLAQVFQVDLIDLLSLNKQGLVWLISGDINGNYSNSNYSNSHISYYGSTTEQSFAVEKLNLQLQHQKELLQQKDQLIEQLYAQISLLKDNKTT